MSKYLKMIAMKGGGKVKVQKASIGRLIGLGARKGVEMLTVSKSAIQKGAKDKVARDKFDEALKNFQKGKPENLENLPLGKYQSYLDKMPEIPSNSITKSTSVMDKLKNLLKKD